jgi:hypothetical protein
MEIVVKKETILDLVPLVLPFDYRFSFTKSSKGDETWFTSNDVAKVWAGMLDLETIGKTDSGYIDTHNELIEEVRETNSNLLRVNTEDSSDEYLEKDKPLYTFANEGLVRVKNINEVMKNFCKAHVLKV